MAEITSYYRPESIAEAVELLSQPHVPATVLSGGAVKLAADGAAFEAVIDVQVIPSLVEISTGADGGLLVGASVSLETLVRDERTPALLREILTRSLTWNRRNGVSLGEAVEYPTEFPELMAALLALDVTLTFAVPGEHRVKLVDLGRDLAQPKLPRHGLMTLAELPPAGPWQTWGTACVARTPRDQAIVSVSAVLVTDETGHVVTARLALTGVWAGPACIAVTASAALSGLPLDDAAIEMTAAKVQAEVTPVADYLGSAAYRRAMVGILTRRALAACRARLTS
ncbi:FAD binding domain-containing protein [Chloroflexota bacterium]